MLPVTLLRDCSVVLLELHVHSAVRGIGPHVETVFN
mgnify:FL=1